MKHLRLLLSVLLLWAAGIGATTANEQNGITYEEIVGSGYLYHEIQRIETDATTLTIPSFGGVVAFASNVYINCPNLTDLYVSRGSTVNPGNAWGLPNSVFKGNFTGMPKLERIHFTNNVWEVGDATFAKDIDVHVARLSYQDNFWGLCETANILLAWSNHSQVKNVYCDDTSSSPVFRYSIYQTTKDFSTGLSWKNAAILSFNSQYNTSLTIPDYYGGTYIDRFGYPGVVTNLYQPSVASLTLEGDFTIDQYSNMPLFPSLVTMTFKKKATLTGADFSGNPLQAVNFYGDVVLGTGFKNSALLKTVYFYGNPPSLTGSAGDYFYNNGQNITFYMNLDKKQIADLKAENPVWSNLNIQSIDPSVNYSKVKYENPGAATGTLVGVKDGVEKRYAIKANYNSNWCIFDKYSTIGYENLQQNSDETRVNGIVLNDTLNMVYKKTAYLTAQVNLLKISYRMLEIPYGSTCDIHFAMVGDGEMQFTEDNEWNQQDEDGEEKFDLYDMDHDGEEHDYTFTNYEQDPFITFWTLCRKPHDGMVHTVRVLANNVPMEPQEIDESYTDEYSLYTYSIEIVGDMDIRIIHEDNSRNLSIVNGQGGTIDLCRGEESTVLATVGAGAGFMDKYANTAQLYALIKPDEGKVVNTIYMDTLAISPAAYITAGDTCRVPITGFDQGEGTFRLTVAYADKPHMTIALSVVGDGKVDALAYKNVDSNYRLLRSTEASEDFGRYQELCVYSDEIDYTEEACDGYVEFRLTLPKEGETLRAFWDGNEVTDKFTLNSTGNFLRASISPTSYTNSLGLFKASSLMAVYEKAHTDLIEFADSVVKAICVANWDTDGDGELSKQEAAAVTTLKKDNGDGTFGDPVFKGNTTITSFDELQYFTGLTEIEENAFHSCAKLLSVQMPEGILKIDKNAFYACSALLDVNIPNTVTELGITAFSQCSKLRNVKLPANLQGITSSFYMCNNLQAFHLPANVTSFNAGSISRCTSLVSISVDVQNTKFDSREGCNAIIDKAQNTLLVGCKNTRIPEGVVAIGPSAFTYQPLSVIEIPASVTYVSSYAFTGCSSLVSVVMKGETPPTLGNNAFSSINSSCVLTVPAGTRDAYIEAGWTEEVFKGGVVEAAAAQTDVNSAVMDFLLVGDINDNVCVDFDPYDGNDVGTGNDFQLVEGDVFNSVELTTELDGGYAGFSIQDLREGDKITVFRNGVDVTSQFTAQPEYSIIYTQFGEGKMFNFETSSWVILIQKSGSNYDINGDGQVTIADVTKLVNKILGKE